LPEALVVPLGSQIVPLHRALAFFLYSAAPLDWAAAVVLLVAFHWLGVVYLYTVLELVHPTRLNAVIVAAYATNVFAGLQFMWFSAGLARAPYVLFALMAIYHYLRFSETRHGLHAVVVCASYAAAIGFYPKGVLIPLYCLGVDVAWRGRAALCVVGRTGKWALLGVLAIASTAYAPLAATADELASNLMLDVSFLLQYLKLGFAVLAYGALGEVLSPSGYQEMGAGVGALVCIFAGYSIYRVRSNWVPWVVGLGLIGLNLAMIGVSNRAAFFGPLVAFQPRYQFESYFLLFLFLGLVIQRLRASAPQLPALPTSALSLLGALLLTQHAVTAYAEFRRVGVPSRAACGYLANLRAGMDGLLARPGRPPTFVDGPFPVVLTPLDFQFRRYSQLFRLLHYKARFGRRGQYCVTENGTIRQRPPHVAGARRRGARRCDASWPALEDALRRTETVPRAPS
jgi:hypothetical protein